MINEYELYHGAAICKLIQSGHLLSIVPFSSISNASFVVNEDTGIFIKYSSKRLTPWRFTFLKEHVKEIEEMDFKLNKVFILLVCFTDGVACINKLQFDSLLQKDCLSAQWISSSRQKRHQYELAGSIGCLSRKISVNDFDKLFKTNNKVDSF